MDRYPPCHMVFFFLVNGSYNKIHHTHVSPDLENMCVCVCLCVFIESYRILIFSCLYTSIGISRQVKYLHQY